MAKVIDLRSDTVTKPSAAMRRAMADAEVGDDVYREDPTVKKLEDRVAEMTGKGGALFVPSGTMSNQIALLCHTQRGDEVIIGEGAHCSFYESGAGPAWSGVQFAVAGKGGLFTATEAEEAIKAPYYYHPRTRLIALENTHNRAGGRVFSQSDVLEIAKVAKDHRLEMHLDGARIWNAAAATGLSVAALCAPFDTVSVCFSKGLGAPVGSAFCASAETMSAALRFRKMLGGGMRQAGVLAAGALYALDHHRERIVEDHLAARAIAEAMGGVRGAWFQRAPTDGPCPRDTKAIVFEPETNIVNIDMVHVDAQVLMNAAKQRGVLVGSMGRRRVRVVTHLDISAEDAARAARALADALQEVLTSDKDAGRSS